MNLQRLLPATAALAALGIWLAWLWQPERQVRLHSETLIRSVERRNWRKVETLLADKYTDRWEHDKGFVVGALRQVFQQFIFLDIQHEIVAADAISGRATANVKISGQGGALAQIVMTKVNALGPPFTFTWEKRSGWPWDWQLVAVDHPTLEPRVDSTF